MNSNYLEFNTNTLKRYHEFESDAMVCSDIDRLIRNHAQESGIREYLPEIGFLPTGEVVFCNGLVKMIPQQAYSINQPDIPASTFNIQPGCEPTFIQHMGHTSRIINDDLRFRGKFIMLRAFDIQNRMNPMLQTPLSQYPQVNSWDMRDVQIARDLGDRFGFTGKWSCSSVNQNWPWTKSPPPFHFLSESFSGLIHVKNSAGTYVYSLQIFYFTNGTYGVLPIAHFQNPFYRIPLKLFIPPAPPYVWVNSELLRQYPNATVILSSDILTTINNTPSGEYIFLGNPGGDDWIEHIDIHSLLGHKVICLMDNFDRAAAQSAINIAGRLNSYDLTPLFALTEKEQPDTALITPGLSRVTAEFIGMRTFLQKAHALGAYIPAEIRLTRNGAIDIENTQTSSPLLENLVGRGEITLVLEHDDVERNIFSSRILSALQANASPFSNHCRNLALSAIKSVVFIDIESKKRYVELIKQAGEKIIENNFDLLFETCFLKQTFEDGIKMFKDIIKTTSAKAVIFDSESMWNERLKNLMLLKEALRFCISENIAIVLICRDQKLIQYLPQPDKLIYIWQYGEKPHNHVVEIEYIAKQSIEPFKFFLLDGKWMSTDFPVEKLTDIPGRKSKTTKPGISPSFDDFLENSSKEDLLGLHKGNKPEDTGNDSYGINYTSKKEGNSQLGKKGRLFLP